MRALLVVVTLAACGGTDPGVMGPGGASGSCDLPALSECHDYGAYTASGIAMQKTICANGQGTWSDGGCSHANAAGGCREVKAGAGTITTWYDTSGPFKTPADVMNFCQQAGKTFVAP